jgi:tRNA(Ile)-lysidine synthetase-like protein
MMHLEASWLGQLQARPDCVRNARVVIACSGGGDSVALLAFLYAVRGSLGLDLTVACADHGLRPEAAAELELVRTLCRRADLDLVEARLDVAGHARSQGLGLETAARELRWAWLKAQAAACRAEVVATGHTLDDHTETVLIRLARGGGAACLTPLPARQGLRWSPLILRRRAELRAYLEQCGLAWMEDASNLSPFTTRNRWRALLESMRDEAPALDRHLLETHLQVEELLAFKEQEVAGWRGRRWQVQNGTLLLARGWPERELRWALEAGFRELGWAREARTLRDLAGWLLPLCGRRTGKIRAWGGYVLAPAENSAPFTWVLAKNCEPEC